MNKIQQNKFHYTIPTNHFDYEKPQIIFPTIKCKDVVESNLLIQEKLKHNLIIEPGAMAGFSFTHPYINSDEVKEDYSEFVESKKESYAKIFENLDASSNEHVKQELKNLLRSNYHITHCRKDDGIVSINTLRRNAEKNGVLPKNWQIDTTYQVI